jgi:hypothetical protein
MPPQKLSDALEQLASAELIFRRGTPPDAEYTFKHALVQEAAYSTLLRNRRQQLHAQIASTLEGQFPEIVATRPAPGQTRGDDTALMLGHVYHAITRCIKMIKLFVYCVVKIFFAQRVYGVG